MSFSLDIKAEILSQEFSKEQAYAFISGLCASSAIFEKNKTILKFNNNDVAETIRDILNQLNIKHISTEENRNWIIIDKLIETDQIKQPSQYFAGTFVGGGSISDPQTTSYHLELQFYSHLEASRVRNFLNKYEFDFSIIQRRKMWVLYLKKSEKITDFLRAIQAFNSLMVFEDERINRDFQNQLNRYSNLDVYNQNKLAKASQRFLDNYQFIKEKNLLSKFREQELTFFEIKKNNIYSSLEDLTFIFQKKTGVSKTRAGLSHYLIKLRKVIKESK